MRLFILLHKPGTHACLVCNHTDAEHFWWIYLKAFCLAGPPQLVYYWVLIDKIIIKCLSQGNNDALPVRQSNRESATFQFLTRRSINCAIVAACLLMSCILLMMPDEFCWFDLVNKFCWFCLVEF